MHQQICWARCNYTIGVYSLGNATSFRPALATVPGLCVQTFGSAALYIDAIAAGQLDMSLCTPTLNTCIMSQYGFQPVAGLLGLNGSTSISGDILVTSASPFTTLPSLRGTRLICGPFYVTAVFQLQAAFLDLPDFFSFFSVVAVEANTTALIDALAAGHFDVAFFRSDQQASYAGDFARDFRVVGGQMASGSRYPSTTPAFPQWQVTAAPWVPSSSRRAVFDVLSSLTPSDPEAVTANISGFGLPYDYDAYRVVLRQLHILNSADICSVTTDRDELPYVSCPAGDIKLSAPDIAKRCAGFPQCAGRFCVCRPCFHPVLEIVLGIRAGIFWPVLASVVAVLWSASWAVQRAQTGSSMVPSIPAETIEVVPSRDGGSRRALLSGQPVALIPLLDPAPNPGWSQHRTWQRAADTCRIEHPNVLPAHGVVRLDGITLLVQDDVSRSLNQYMEGGPRDVKDVVRLAKEVACGMQRLHGDETPVLYRPTSRSIRVDVEGHVRLQLCEFTHPPSKSSAEDVGFLGRLMQKMWLDSGYSHDITRQCTLPMLRDRPKVAHVLTALTAIEQQLRASQQRLLNSILPSFASEAMSLGMDVQPRTHESVAIVFCDIVGFTTICDRLAASDIVDMLSRLYVAFDRLAISHDIHKQEIVGDCWVGTTNVLTDQVQDFAARMAGFALELVQAAQQTPVRAAEPTCLNVRVGIHTGPVVSGVVGITLNPKFCCVGDSMNIAARMEQSSVRNMVHLSEAAAHKVAEQSEALAARITPRDQLIDVKGKGRMQTYWLS